MSTQTDYTPSGIRLESAYENDRNGENSALYKDIIREVYGVKDVICGHHLVYQVEDKRADGFTYTFVEEVPSADTLIFDTDVAQKLWGDKWQHVLCALAITPIAARDRLLGEFYYGRQHEKEAA